MDLLFVSANSRSEYVDIEREHKILLKLFDSPGHSFGVLPAADIPDLRNALRANKESREFDVLHFCGHASEEHGLHLRGKGHRPAYMSGNTLKRHLKGSGIRLVVLNACHSEHLANTLSEVVPAVIGTTRVVRDVAARCFTRDFYEALMDQPSVSAALSAALAKRKPGSSPAYVLVGVDLQLS